jgi:C1A family cysteine protease
MQNFKIAKKWLPDLPDHRDLKYKMSNMKLPVSMDLRDEDSAIKDQGDLGSCTGNAIASLIEEELVAKTEISALFIYFQERKLEGSISNDSGASIRDGIKACAKVGACSEQFYPYIVEAFKKEPSALAYANAMHRKLLSYRRVSNLKEMLDCIASGHGIVMGFTVYESFLTEEVANTGIMPYPKLLERAAGGHAVVAIGYNTHKKMLLVKNSWGDDWGQNGYFWMPFKVIQNRNMSDDFWTIMM